MAHILIKPERDQDFYVSWSSIVEAPLWWGPRAEAVNYLISDARQYGGPSDPPEERLARTDEYGSSIKPEANYGFGYWDDEEFIYEQRGFLPRKHLIEACRRLATEDESGVWDLMEPFEDEAEVRRG